VTEYGVMHLILMHLANKLIEKATEYKHSHDFTDPDESEFYTFVFSG